MRSGWGLVVYVVCTMIVIICHPPCLHCDWFCLGGSVGYFHFVAAEKRTESSRTLTSVPLSSGGYAAAPITRKSPTSNGSALMAA